MRKFTRITSRAAPLPESDVDTDTILPAQFLLLLGKKGMGKHLFHERRRREPSARFILDQAPYTDAEILIAGPRFGVGSSREHAVWALSDFGIRCVIAPSFGDIFYANCFKNGILPLTLSDADHHRAMKAAEDARMFAVDLEQRRIEIEGKSVIDFNIDDHRRHALIQGLDEISAILLEDANAIDAFEDKQRQASPWLYLTANQLSSFENH